MERAEENLEPKSVMKVACPEASSWKKRGMLKFAPALSDIVCYDVKCDLAGHSPEARKFAMYIFPLYRSVNTMHYFADCFPWRGQGGNIRLCELCSTRARRKVIASPATDVKLGTSGRWVGDQTGAGVTATLV